MNQSYMEESLQRDIERIRSHVVEMARRVEKALRDCVKAFLENDRKIAYAVILRDQYVDEKEKEIDRLCLEFLVRQQPVGFPLRFAYSTIKINLEIERVGDYAESVARFLLRVRDQPSQHARNGIIELADMATRMFHDAIQAFLNQDAELAKKNIAIEESVNALRMQLIGDLVRQTSDGKVTFESVDPLFTMIRRFERVADQARNICMETLYMCTGEYAKHPGAEAFRILFVDDHNACQSQMAEAIAQGMKLPKFIFSSAGVDPRPMDHGAVDFMKTKGFDLSRLAPKAIHQIPNLDHYQVIVALSHDAYRAFPKHPRKVIFLDWQAENPTVLGGTDRSAVAYDKVYEFIDGQMKDLIEAVTDADIERKDS